MVGKHCGSQMDTVHDGCIKIIKQCRKCHNKFTQNKRRPRNTPLTECTWVVLCDDHKDNHVEI
jgi:hypothetical protein